MTATWARLAASATRVKSLRKTSVEGFLRSWGGGAGAEAIWLGEVRSEEAAAVEEAPPCDGDEMGASISVVCLCKDEKRRRRRKIKARSMSAFATGNDGKIPVS